MLVLAGPYLRLDYEIDKRPVVALMFDESRSMQLPAGPFEEGEDVAGLARAVSAPEPAGPSPPGPITASQRALVEGLSRLKLAQAVVSAGRARFLAPLAERFDVRGYAFGRETVPVVVDPKAERLELPDLPDHDAAATHLGDAIGRVLDDAAGRPVAGVFVFTDGQNTGGRSPAEAVGVAARAGAPVFAVPAGSKARPKDVAIADVFTSGLVAVNDTARVSVTVESQGLDARPTKVELREGDKVLDTKTVTLRDAEQQKVELSFQAREPGRSTSRS